MLIILFYTFKKIFKENSKTISFLLTLIENGIKKKKKKHGKPFFVFYKNTRLVVKTKHSIPILLFQEKPPWKFLTFTGVI